MSHNNLGELFRSTRRPEKAEPAFRDAIAFQKHAVASFPDRPEFRLELAGHLFNLGNLIRDKGLLTEAEAIYGEALPIKKQLVAVFPGRPEFREELAAGHNDVGLLLRDKGLLKEAEAARPRPWPFRSGSPPSSPRSPIIATPSPAHCANWRTWQASVATSPPPAVSSTRRSPTTRPR